jgi:hypothetical protein
VSRKLSSGQMTERDEVSSQALATNQPKWFYIMDSGPYFPSLPLGLSIISMVGKIKTEFLLP